MSDARRQYDELREREHPVSRDEYRQLCAAIVEIAALLWLAFAILLGKSRGVNRNDCQDGIDRALALEAAWKGRS